jgi:hypothetical protein
MGLATLALVVTLVSLTAAPAEAAVPWPVAPDDVAPEAYHEYLFLDEPARPGSPDDYRGGDVWKYSSRPSGHPEVDNDPTELHGVTGMSVDEAWTLSTGRPDTVIAVLDSGIRWEEADLKRKAYLNTGELPLPEGQSTYDANGDGVVNAADYEDDPRVSDPNRNGIIDAGDLIRVFSDGVDDDGNGFTDDISGWNFLDDTNNPFDEVDYSHGTGEAEDSTAEAANGDGFPGTCPNCAFLPLRVGQSFIAHEADYGRAVLYAVDNGASLVQEALGTTDKTPTGTFAHRYAWTHGVPIVASAADEAAQHHNWPSSHRYSIVVNSIRTSGEAIVTPRSSLYVNGCTNVGTAVTATVSSTSCSSEATGRMAGIVGLLQAHARNVVARGDLEPHPDADEWAASNVLSPAEVRGLVQETADDIALGPRPVASPVPTTRYPSTPGWDPFTGAGRVDAAGLLERVSTGEIPPEANIDAPARWEPMTPGEAVVVDATMDAWRSPLGATYRLEVGCTDHPRVYRTLEEGVLGGGRADARWSVTHEEIRRRCPDLAPTSTEGTPQYRPDESRTTALLRLTVTDGRGLDARDRRAVIIHEDPDLGEGWPKRLPGSFESSPDLVDLDDDGADELVVSSSSGAVHALDADGEALPGFPVRTDPLPYAENHDLPGPTPRYSGSHGGTGIADLEGDGDLEVVLTTLQGRVYAWHHDGTPVDGWPRSADPAFSEPSIRDEHNTLIQGFQAAPVLVDLDGDDDREVVAAGLDRHLYAWHDDGTPVDGFPRLLADRTKVTVDPETGAVTPKPGADPYRGSKIVSTPAACDLTGDGAPELVVGTNEHYPEPLAATAASTGQALSQVTGGANGRLFAVDGDGSSVEGWPAKVPDLLPEILPYVGQGVVASPACGDVDADGGDEAFVMASVGPVVGFDGDGTPHLGDGPDGRQRPFTMAEPGPTSGAADLPYIPGIGSPSLATVGDAEAGVVAPSSGLGRLLDVLLPGRQLHRQDYVAAWNANTGGPLEAWPRPIEDLQFLTTQAIFDANGDDRNDVVAVSAGGSVHAWDGATGAQLPGFPKVTGNWMMGTPTPGDLDGDDTLELAVTSREGLVWTWDLGGDEVTRGWWTDHHDAANTGRWDGDPGPTSVAPAPAVTTPADPATQKRVGKWARHVETACEEADGPLGC